MGNPFSCPKRDESPHFQTSKEGISFLGWQAYWEEVGAYWSSQWVTAMASSIDYYQFGIYGNVEPGISQTLFGGSDTVSWVVYAIPFVTGPFGGAFFGTVADRYGRRPAILGTLVMMLGSSIGQGLTPAISYVGPIWMVTCRMLQGMALGGQVGSMPVYVTEQSSCHILTMAAMVSKAELGSSASSLVALILAGILTDEQLLSWGWRVPYLLVIIPGVYVIWAARSIPESLAFSEMQCEEDYEELDFTHQIQLVKEHWAQMTVAVTGALGSYTVIYLAGTYLQEWLGMYCGASSVTTSWVNFGGNFMCIPIVLPFALFGDFFGLGKLNILNSSFALITAIPMYAILYTRPNIAIINFTFGALMSAILQAATVGAFPFVASLFPTKIRGTCSSISCNIAYLVGGIAPAICTATGDPMSIAYYTAICCGTSLVASLVALSMHSQYQENYGGPQISHLRELY